MHSKSPSKISMSKKKENDEKTKSKIEGFTTEELPTQDSVTNQLLLKYDDKFNKNYDKTNTLNKAIMSKDKLIYLTEVDSAKKVKLLESWFIYLYW